MKRSLHESLKVERRLTNHLKTGTLKYRCTRSYHKILWQSVLHSGLSACCQTHQLCTDATPQTPPEPDHGDPHLCAEPSAYPPAAAVEEPGVRQHPSGSGSPSGAGPQTPHTGTFPILMYKKPIDKTIKKHQELENKQSKLILYSQYY